ncbi:sin3 histone deacetylase corepressor complex component SDS3 isoform X1 [Passer domesticus]|uniref:sin3 histone deacetylase corepressor complex component SDS3 isoform X1 n=1 Tax=Passer domesticus TaxID=48849 RepID=UPI0030FEAE3B
MSAAGLVSAPPAAPPGPPAPAMAPAPDYYEEEELESAEEEDGERSARARDSDEDTEDASETDLAKHEEEDFVEMKEQMYQDKLASLKRQLQQLQEGTLQEYQKRMKKLDQQYKERIRNAELFLQLETDQVEKNYVKEKKAAAKEFEDKKIELKENLIAELEEKKKMIENEKLTMELTGDSMEVKPIMTRKLRRRPNDPVPIPDKRRKPAPDILSWSHCWVCSPCAAHLCCFVQQGEGNEMPGSDFNLGNTEAQLSCIMCAKAMPAVVEFNTCIETSVWRSLGILT